MDIKLILTDIDGVWTDGGMFYDNTDLEFKKFNTKDSAGVLFARKAGLEVGILTGENTEIMARRARKLKIDLLHQGVKNKKRLIEQIIAEKGIAWENVAYIGDDLIDIPSLQLAGFSACPNDAPEYVKDVVHFITPKKGGDGCFRDFVEELFTITGQLDELVMAIVDDLS
jgi:YrbI family 3-deoxy-D-manno-octulosonate 8-phosphate phosphatase